MYASFPTTGSVLVISPPTYSKSSAITLSHLLFLQNLCNRFQEVVLLLFDYSSFNFLFLNLLLQIANAEFGIKTLKKGKIQLRIIVDPELSPSSNEGTQLFVLDGVFDVQRFY